MIKKAFATLAVFAGATLSAAAAVLAADNGMLDVKRTFAGVETVSGKAFITDGRLEPATALKQGEIWPDDKGVHINAHSAGILVHDGIFYWYGEHKIAGGAGNAAHVGVHVYSSLDLRSWKDEGIALKVSDDPKSDIAKGRVIERPKVIFNKKTGKFVMWFHLELDPSYAAARSGVAVADSPVGPFTFIESFRPNAGFWPLNVPKEFQKPLSPEEADRVARSEMSGSYMADYCRQDCRILRRDFAGGQMARDMNLFVDDDGKAYHIYASEGNSTLQISLLSDDYLKPAGTYARVFPMAYNEAPAIMKHQGKYYMISSGCTGWAPNAARSAVADSIFGPWKELGNPCVGVNPQMKLGPEKTFGGQSTFILPLPGRSGSFIALFDQWRPENAIDGRYFWLPVRFEGEGFKVDWTDEWNPTPAPTLKAAPAPGPAAVPKTCYLFAYFINNGEDGLHLAWSPDGLKWQALKRGQSFLKPVVGNSKLMRDPCIATGPDGTFHMVWTDSWFGGTIGYASSKDLIHWSEQRALPVMAHEPATRNCWAPEIVYDKMQKKFVIFWASTIPGKFPETELGGQNDLNHRIYATTTRDFQTFTPTTVFFNPGYNCIDSTILLCNGRSVMIFKDENKVPVPMKNLRLATASTPAGPFTVEPAPINAPGSWVEGPTALRIGDETILYFDAYTRHRYEALATRDFKTWRDVSKDLAMPQGIRHGTAFAVPGAVVRELLTATESVTATVADNGRTLTVVAPGLDSFRAGFSATVEIGGVRKVLRSAEGVPAKALKTATEKTPYGKASVMVSTVEFPAEKLALELRMGQVKGVPGVLVQPVLHNRGTQPVCLVSLAAVDMPLPPPVHQLPAKDGKIYLTAQAATAIREGHGKCQSDRSTGGNPLSIGGKTFVRGLGTHARSDIEIPLGAAFTRFHAFVGADDEIEGGSVGFEVVVDGQKRFASGVMRKGDAAKEVDVDLSGANSLLLVVNDGGDGITCDHADWAEACLTPASTAGDAKVADPLQMAFPGKAADWLVTSLDQSSNGGPFTYAATLAELAAGMNVREYGTIYRQDGAGFLFGPVGEPLAYLENRMVGKADCTATLRISSDMSGVLVDAGESRAGQQAVLLMEPPRQALARWSEWVAKTHGARTDKGAFTGWCSWYHLTSNIKGSDVLGIVDAVKKDPARLRPQVIQIDDGYQDIDGKWDANAKFAEGMPYYARRIAETGARPGLWMAMTMIGVKSPWLKDPANREAVWNNAFRKESPFRPDETGWLDPTHPRAKAYIVERIRHAVDSGFTYLKLDFNNIGNGGWYEKKKTSFQILREHYQRMRAAAGEDTYILACMTDPNRAVLGLVDAHRISHDAHRGGVRSAINDVLRSYQLNGRWLAVDNDIYYIAPDVKEVGGVQGGWNLHRTWLSLMGLSGGAALTSDPWHWEVLKPHLRTVEIMQPPAKLRTEVLDLGTDKEWPRLAAQVKRPWGDSAVALLWNPDERQPRGFTLDLAQAGLDPQRTCAVWSFWDNRYLGTAKGSWSTPPLEGWACQQLRFTPVDGEAAGKPVLIGSNLHISAGVAEIKKVAASATGITIDLTDAGARDGDLFVYSAKPLVLASAVGCTVKGVEPAGDKVWVIHLAARQPGKPQQVRLDAGRKQEKSLAGWSFRANRSCGVPHARPGTLVNSQGALTTGCLDRLGGTAFAAIVQCAPEVSAATVIAK